MRERESGNVLKIIKDSFYEVPIYIEKHKIHKDQIISLQVLDDDRWVLIIWD